MFGLSTKSAWGFFAILGIFTGLVAFGNSITPTQHPETAGAIETKTPADDGNLSANLIGAPSPMTQETTPDTDGNPAEKATNDASDDNLTKKLASVIGKGIVDRNPKGPQDGNFVVQSTENAATDAVEAAIKNFDARRFVPDVLPSDIVIDTTVSEAAYRATITKTLKDIEGGFVSSQADPLTDRLIAIATYYGTIAEALKKIAVPPSIVIEHTTALRLALGKKVMTEAVAQYETDPVYAMVALKTLGTIR